MKKIWNCRRTYLATLGIICLTTLGLTVGMDGVAIAIAGIVGAVAGANAYQKSKAAQAE